MQKMCADIQTKRFSIWNKFWTGGWKTKSPSLNQRMWMVLLWPEPAKITLWASTSWPSPQTRVTSENSLASLIILKQSWHYYRAKSRVTIFLFLIYAAWDSVASVLQLLLGWLAVTGWSQYHGQILSLERAWKVADKLGTKTLLIALLFFGKKWTGCAGCYCQVESYLPVTVKCR